jgi:AcrR family transcriptional regulator
MGGMAPRPRISSDADLLAATHRAISRLGPSRLTLADVAAEANVAPATLVQRFGSKRGLLLTLASQGSGASAAEMAALRARHSSPLAALRAFAECMAGMASSPQELANHLAFLVIDLTDPDFHRHALAQARYFQAELEAIVKEAVTADELIPCDAEGLARLLQEAVHGALVTWAIYREGTALDWIRRDMDTLLAPYESRKPWRTPNSRRHGGKRRRRGI